MRVNTDKTLRDKSPYSAIITREHFLFNEMKMTAELKSEGLDDNTVVGHIISENSFNYPTDKSLRQMAGACVRRLNAMEDPALVITLASASDHAGKQICLYAMMVQNRLVRDFMVDVIGSKYRLSDSSFCKMDVDAYLKGLQSVDPWVNTWSKSTITKVRQVLMKVLVENGYLSDIDSTNLNLISIEPILEHSIREKKQEELLPAFNCLK